MVSVVTLRGNGTARTRERRVAGSEAAARRRLVCLTVLARLVRLGRWPVRTRLRTLAVRENAAWCDLVCRLHRFTPEGDGRLWWSARRTPDLFPDAVTLVPDLSVLDVLGRINDSFGAVG